MASNNDKWKSLVFLSLGSNLGDTIKYLELGRKLIKNRVGNIELTSSIYKTEAWGQQNLNLFYNQMIGVSTQLQALTILEICQDIELQLGRKPKLTSAYENRTLDIDLIIYGGQIIKTKKLIVPHPQMHNRNFVLVPFAEIAPDFIHPEMNKSIENLKNNCTDHNKIEQIE